MNVLAKSLDRFKFGNSYAGLHEKFYQRIHPTPVASPSLIRINEPLARDLQLDPERLAEPEGVAILAGNVVPGGSRPVAMAYAGHQFGNFVPQLGDGRAILLGELTDRQGVRRDVQLKGSGRTRFSRRGDGRAALGPVLREYIISEYMAAVGIPTTRALAAVTTGETVWRDTGLPGAVLTRVASSHIRIGTFQYFAAQQDVDAVRCLADYVIDRHYPQVAESVDRYSGLLNEVIARQAELIAQWMLVGFIHGVMNTDNVSIAGETIDYGPCAFMDAYNPAAVYSSIDALGRYAYGNQPRIAEWNLARFAESLMPLLSKDDDVALQRAQQAIDCFRPQFESAYVGGLSRKLGLREQRAGDFVLAQELLDLMSVNEADFTMTFRRLCDAAEDRQADDAIGALFTNPSSFDEWATKWRRRLHEEPVAAHDRSAAMRAVNPLFIPRNHRVEQAISAAVSGDFMPFETLLAVLARPFDDQSQFMRYADPPRPEEIVRQTFCGT